MCHPEAAGTQASEVVAAAGHHQGEPGSGHRRERSQATEEGDRREPERSLVPEATQGTEVRHRSAVVVHLEEPEYHRTQEVVQCSEVPHQPGEHPSHQQESLLLRTW